MRDQILALKAQGFSHKSIATQLGIGMSTISYHVKKSGLYPKYVPFTHDWKSIQLYYDAGHSSKECLEKFNINRSSWCLAIRAGRLKAAIRENSLIFIERWIKGEVSGNCLGDYQNVKHSIRKYVIQLRGSKCELCGWDKVSEHTGKSPLHLDHIDGNYKNSSLENLRVLCPNCHSLTSTYGSLNRGNGRPYVIQKKQPKSCA